MRKSVYVTPDNIGDFKKEYSPEIAIIARPDWFIKERDLQHVIVETKHGIHNRCFVAKHDDVRFLIIYGRFDRIRSTARDIDFELTQGAVSMLGIRKMIG